MSHLDELKAETREIIADLLNDGSNPNALYIIEHHISHRNFDKLEKIAMWSARISQPPAQWSQDVVVDFRSNGRAWKR